MGGQQQYIISVDYKKLNSSILEMAQNTDLKIFLEKGGELNHLEIRNIPGKGRGVITTRPIRKGQLVVEYKGALYIGAEVKKMETKYRVDSRCRDYWFYFDHAKKQHM